MNKTRTYSLSDGTSATFSTDGFRLALRKEKDRREHSGTKCTIQMLLDELSDTTGSSFSSLKHWCAGHNAPSDVTKVEDLAEALHTDITLLLNFDFENEKEFSEMNTNMISTMTENKIDRTSVEGTLRSICSGMVTFIETVRMTGAGNTDAAILKPMFCVLYTSLMQLRFDLPHDLFRRLESFAVNYLQQMICYIEFARYWDDADGGFPSENVFATAVSYAETYADAYNCAACAPWSTCLYVSVDPACEDCRAFEQAVRDEYTAFDQEVSDIRYEMVIEKAYSLLDSIVAEHLEK